MTRSDASHQQAQWNGRRVVIAGLGVTGQSVARALAPFGTSLVAVAEQEPRQADVAVMAELGVEVRWGENETAVVPRVAGELADIIITSPGWSPATRMMHDAVRQRVPVWGDVELAWRLRPATNPAPWLAVTGTNGKTTTVKMLASMIGASGLTCVAAGNVGTPLIDVVLSPEPVDAIAVELSSFQLHWTNSFSPLSSVVLNVAPDHLDWHGGAEGYAADKAKIYERVKRACVYNVADPQTRAMVEDADVCEGARAIGFGLGTPRVGELGLVEDILVDRAFHPEHQHSGVELATLADFSPALRGGAGQTVAPHLIEDALAAAALARSLEVPASAIRHGLREFLPDGHRNALVRVVDGVCYVNDSKATNTHAAHASLQPLAHGSVVWIAGGLAKGASYDALVAATADRLRAIVLIGIDRTPLRGALSRHAPAIPVIEIEPGDTGGVTNASAHALMERAVAQARSLAHAGDTVLLAPASASMDQFDSYTHRGQVFESAVAALVPSRE